MAACSGLQVILRVEVSVHENDRVSSCKVQAHSPCKDSLLGSQNHIVWEPYSHSFKNYTQKVTICGRKLGFSLLTFTLCISPAKRSCWPYLHQSVILLQLLSLSHLSATSLNPAVHLHIQKSFQVQPTKKKGCKITTSHQKLTLNQNIRKTVQILHPRYIKNHNTR